MAHENTKNALCDASETIGNPAGTSLPPVYLIAATRTEINSFTNAKVESCQADL
jgi:hypothetical protein